MSSTTNAIDSAADNRRAYLLMIITTWCWGCNAILGKLAVDEISPMMLVTLRWLGAVIVLAIFARKYVFQDWQVLRQNLRYTFFMGAVGFTGFNTLFYIAAHSTSAINIGILQGAIPVFIILGSFLFQRIKVSRIQLSGILVTLVGVCVIASAGDPGQLLTLKINRGDFFMLLACFCYAVYSVGLTRRPTVSSLGLFTLIAVFAMISSLPMLAIEALQEGLQWPTTTGWGVVLAAILLPSLLAQISFIQSVGLIGPGRAGVFVNLVPVFAAIMAVFILGESFEVFHAIALILVLGGIALSELGKHK
ncbi:MAG: DMT family transporter [Gammaproteobacteria bacterium]|nr:DMT family transporter [Gammaproteobacteria bacterium]